MIKQKLEFAFLAMILLAGFVLVSNYYKTTSFKNNPLPQSYIDQIQAKEEDVLQHMQKNYGFRYKFPLIVTDKIPGRLYGLTSYDNGEIKIYLNKKVMQESFKYMIESVIPHEYAHALLFKLQHFTKEKAGHSRVWQETCVNLGGKDCQQYVDQHEIIMSKMPFQ